MPTIVIRLPEVETAAKRRPRHCPYCGSAILQSWGPVSKKIRDTHHEETELRRYRCCDCKRTFRAYPEGVDRSKQSLRIRHLAALAWAMGMSCRDVVEMFQELGVSLSRMTVWRAGQELLARLGQEGDSGRGRGFALERGNIGRYWRRHGVAVVIDLGRGKSILLGAVKEPNPRVVKSRLEPLIKETDIELSLLGTDALNPSRLPTH